MKKFITPGSFLKKNILFFSGIIALVFFVKCTGGGNEEPEPSTTSNFTTRIYDSLKYPIFILDSQTIANHPRLRQQPSDYRNLILKYRFNGIKNDTVDIDLFVYPANNHGQHGVGETPIVLLHKDTGYIKLPDSLNWGNNYVNWWRVKETILKSNGPFPRDLITNFAYIKFTPTNRDLGMVWDEQHLRFKITGTDKDGNNIILQFGGAGGDGSHPSPPAPPGN